MTDRPKRPTREFLDKIEISSIPEDVDITFQDGGGRYGDNRITTVPRSFVISKRNTKGDLEKQQLVNAFEDSAIGRGVKEIYADVHKTLIDFGATPAGPKNNGIAA